MTPAALQLEGISKRFGGVTALSDISLTIQAGQVHAVVGQNGSGKSTLVKIIAGYHAPEPGGAAWAWGKPLPLPVTEPRRYGIAVIHQDLGLVSGLTVLENFGAPSDFGSGSWGPIRWRRERQRAREIFARLDLPVDPDAVVADISPPERAMVAIGRAIRQIEDSGRREVVLVLDEPTVYLTRSEVDRLIVRVRGLADVGAAILFISHRLREVLRISDEISVLRDGRLVKTLSQTTATESQVLTLMLGRDIGEYIPVKAAGPAAEGALVVEGLKGTWNQPISFSVGVGEILGVTGLAGMGQDEIPYLIFGASRRRAGAVRMSTVTELRPGPSEAVSRGMALLPADRTRYGGWLAATCAENITLPVLRRYFRRFYLDAAAELRDSRALMVRFGVVPSAPERQLSTFSGGNQQKVLLAKWLQIEPRTLLLHEPTQGVDAGAKRDIFRIIAEVAARGAAVVIFSSDYEQLAYLCHRVAVIRDGSLVTMLAGDNVREDLIAKSCHAS